MKHVHCHITKKILASEDAHRGDFIRKEILALIQKDHPDFTQHSYISPEELSRYRRQYLHKMIKLEEGELNSLERDVVEAISKNTLLSEDMGVVLDKELTLGQKVADVIAQFGGSWTFIIIFFLIFTVWITMNVWVFAFKPFDPYPFILLNLILSCVAALQAPVIMMSQNRLEEKDRRRGEQDYKVNLKAELEIRLLDEKIEHLMTHQYKRLLDIQELQTDYLEDLVKKVKGS